MESSGNQLGEIRNKNHNQGARLLAALALSPEANGQ
jgi:hypothetical protein